MVCEALSPWQSHRGHHALGTTTVGRRVGTFTPGIAKSSRSCQQCTARLVAPISLITYEERVRYAGP